MLLGILTLVIMLAVGYSYLREGIFTAFCMFINTFFAGLMAFNFWEPLADLLDPLFADNFLHGYEDAMCLVLIFALTLGILRTTSNAIARAEVTYPQWLKRGGGVVFGMATGYLVSGFMLCMLQTLPWHENFMFYEPYVGRGSGEGLRRYLPPDRAWLGLMHRAGAISFSWFEDPQFTDETSAYGRYITFDKYGNFVVRYARYRRYNDGREALQYQGECDQQLNRQH